MAEAYERIHYDRFSVLVTISGFQTIRNYPIKSDSAVRFEVTVASNQTDQGNRSTFRRTFLVYRVGAGPVIMQQLLTDQTIKSNSNLDIKFVVQSTSVQMQVKNAGVVSTRWTGYTDRIDVK